MEKGGDIHDQVRDLLGGDDGGLSQGTRAEGGGSDSSQLKAGLVSIIQRYGRYVKSSRQLNWDYRMRLKENLSALLAEYGVEAVLQAIEELKPELEEVEIKFPDYLDSTQADLELAKAIVELPEYIESMRRMREAHARRDQLEDSRREFFRRHHSP